MSKQARTFEEVLDDRRVAEIESNRENLATAMVYLDEARRRRLQEIKAIDDLRREIAGFASGTCHDIARVKELYNKAQALR